MAVQFGSMQQKSFDGPAPWAFKYENFNGGQIIMVEPKKFVENMANGNFDPRDTCISDVTVFTKESLAKGEHSEFFPGQQLTGAAIVPGLSDLIGEAVVVTIGKGVAKPGKRAPWVFNNVSMDSEEFKAVVKYAEKRGDSPAAAEPPNPLDETPDGPPPF